MAAGLMISFGPDKGGKGKPPGSPSKPMGDEGDDLEGTPEQAALDGMKKALENNDPELLVKSFKLLQRCCKDDEESPASEEY